MAADNQLQEQIDLVCHGWADAKHWNFQRELFTKIPSIREICIVGVYMGRDTAYMAAHLSALHGDEFHITAVDLFSDQPCADWPEEKRGLTWEQAGFGSAPQLGAVRQSMETLGYDKRVTLVKQDAAEFLRSTDQEFDLIYIDTSHDYETTRETILAALPKLRATGVLAGDDYSDEGTWGVKRAVTELCPQHRVFMNWIWYAPKVFFNV